jgi:hypothetical protein
MFSRTHLRHRFKTRSALSTVVRDFDDSSGGVLMHLVRVHNASILKKLHHRLLFFGSIPR